MAFTSNVLASSFIFISSKDRINVNENSSHFSVRVNDLSSNLEKNISIEHLTIPYSYYAINSNNNTFLANATTVTMTPGNYSSSTFITEIQTQLNAASLGATFVGAVSATTGKMSLTASTGTFSITSDTKNNRYLGLPVSTAKSSAAAVWTSSNPIDLSGTTFVQVETDIPISSTNTNNQNTNVLCRVFPNVNAFNVINYTSSSFQFLKMLTKRLNQINLRLVDDNGDTLSLNGLEWSITLEVCDY